MEATIQKWGNSLGIRIPSAMAKDLHLKNGSPVEIDDIDGKIVIKPDNKADLLKKIAKINKKNIHFSS